ncbi:MAG: sulfite exporter TauE/SafE family protein, partial [Acetobacteraceae bacterium]|nr:sulfite exporter TauE/SafE family protein [Acetobacteraceae bacterium]
AVLMIVVGVLMLRPRRAASGTGEERLSVRSLGRITVSALLVGALSGFFGIGGGFLIVPGLIFATGMPMINAIGSSLLSVGSFGATTAANYALSGLVAWALAAEFIGGGVLGGLLGMRLALRVSGHRATLNRIFAGLIFVVAAYMLYRNAGTLGI